MPSTIERGRGASRPARRDQGARAAQRTQAARHEGEQERRDDRLPQRRRGLRRPAGHGQRPSEQRVGQGQGHRRVAGVPEPAHRSRRAPPTARPGPAAHREAGSNPSGSMPIPPGAVDCDTRHGARPATAPRWSAALRPARCRGPTCGAVTQPMAVTVVSTARPVAAAAQAAMAPVTTSGRAPGCRDPEPGPDRAGLGRAGGLGGHQARGRPGSAETLTNPILATSVPPPNRRAARHRLIPRGETMPPGLALARGSRVSGGQGEADPAVRARNG